MDLETYSREAMVTAVFNPVHHVSYPALGLCDEAAEFIEKFWGPYSDEDRILELGDLLWYYNCICHYTGLNIVDHFENNATVIDTDSLFIVVGKICGIAKKSLRDNGGSVDKMKLYPYMDELAGIINAFCDDLYTTVEDVAEKNIAKLRSRQTRNVIKGNGDNR